VRRVRGESNSTIYVSDVDGTLLGDDGVLSDYSREKLKGLLEAGVNFTVASARSIVSLHQTLGEMPFRLPVIEINGAFITDFHSREHLFINAMDGELAREVCGHIRSCGCLPFVAAFNGSDRLYYERVLNEGMGWYLDNRKACNDERLRRVERLEDVLDERVVAFTVVNTYDKLKGLAEKVSGDLGGRLQTHFFENPYSPPWWWLTIHDKQACKSNAIRTLVDYAGFRMDKLVVFGDNLNDVRMFKMAARAVAVENASDEIKQYATEIIGPNEDDSVVKYVTGKEND